MKVTRIIAASLMLAAASTAQAQQTTYCDGASAFDANCKVTNTVSATVGFAARLMLNNTSTTLTAPTAANFGTSAGVTNANALTIAVSSNVEYTLTASAATTNFSGGSGNKPATDLKISVDGGSFGSIGQIGTEGAATASTVYTIGYNTIYNWLIDTPGTYTLAINYTLTSP